MKIGIIGGTGYVGLVTGLGFAAKGHQVVCADIDSAKIERIKSGELPIYEKGLEELLISAVKNKRISFTDCIKEAVVCCDVIMIAVGTPEGKNGKADMSYFFKAVKSVVKCINSINPCDGKSGNYKVIVAKSTVPVGTCELARMLVHNGLKSTFVEVDVASNPEFLREGNAVDDFLNPERIVIGSYNERTSEIMKELYAQFEAPIIFTDPKSAEMIKYACNAYLASRISFINEIAEICAKTGADINGVIEGMKYDHRIGKHYLSPGPGFGGPCLSKDLKSLINFASNANANVDMLKSVLKRNNIQISNIAREILHELRFMEGRKIAILGLSFKKDTDDTRNSPSLLLIQKLIDTNAKIFVYDPKVNSLSKDLGSKVYFANTAYEAVDEADCMVVMTEWDEFKNLDLKFIFSIMKTPFIYDARNIIDMKYAADIGFSYMGIGIKSSNNKVMQENARRYEFMVNKEIV